MNFFTLYQISADPLFNPNVTVTNAFQVAITDNDNQLENPDADGSQQFDVSGIAGLNTSEDFQVFENYTANVGGSPVTFTLLQWQGTQYIVVTSGQVAVNDVLSGNTLTQNPASPSVYDTLPTFVCFTSGSLILTPSGRRLIETLEPEDEVITADGSARPVRWIGRRQLSAQELKRDPHLCPVRIRAGRFTEGCPSRDLLVSPQHRIAVTSAVMELYYFDTVMLAPAKGMVDGQGIEQLPPEQGVEYIHILFDKHELVNVEGVWSESFFPGDTTMSAMATATKRELFELFPELMCSKTGYGETALPVLKPYEVRLLQSDLSVPMIFPKKGDTTYAAEHSA
ncbi:Hint domain-containing protein [Ruegeria sp. AU67]|uniref:Hint domain-containing protein n=1 Tax=Ruegeria sp. AU67 TaxID=2108530 RepID=UPI000D688E4A|nr:Hint domain-containing protein [Ruegeria sp. AU67]